MKDNLKLEAEVGGGGRVIPKTVLFIIIIIILFFAPLTKCQITSLHSYRAIKEGDLAGAHARAAGCGKSSYSRI